MDLRFVPEKEKELLKKRDKEGWILYTAGIECPGTTFIGACVTTALLITGFFTFLLTWIPAFMVMGFSMNTKTKKYANKHRDKLEIKYIQRLAAWDIEMERQNKRQQLKAQGIPTCPSCMSEKVEVFAQISNLPKMVCKVCGRTFNPGE